MPTMQAQLVQLEKRINERQEVLNQNEDRIANILTHTPKSLENDKFVEDDFDAENGEKEKLLRAQDILKQDVQSEADTEKRAF